MMDLETRQKLAVLREASSPEARQWHAHPFWWLYPKDVPECEATEDRQAAKITEPTSQGSKQTATYA